MGEPSDQELLSALRRVMHEMRRHSMSALEPYGLTPHQGRAFLAISRGVDGEPIRLKDLADRLHIAPRSATEVVDGLEQRGLVHRAPAPGDRRAVVVAPTAEGAGIAEQVRAAQDDLPSLAGLSTADRRTLARLLARMQPPPVDHA